MRQRPCVSDHANSIVKHVHVQCHAVNARADVYWPLELEAFKWIAISKPQARHLHSAYEESEQQHAFLYLAKAVWLSQGTAQQAMCSYCILACLHITLLHGCPQAITVLTVQNTELTARLTYSAGQVHLWVQPVRHSCHQDQQGCHSVFP